MGCVGFLFPPPRISSRAASVDAAGPDLYTVQLSLEISGAIDYAALRRAANSLLQRHPHLGAAFHQEGREQASQVIAANVAPIAGWP